MTRQEIIKTLDDIEYHFAECARNADKRSNAYKRFTRWMEALLFAKNIILDCDLDGYLLEDDGK